MDDLDEGSTTALPAVFQIFQLFVTNVDRVVHGGKDIHYGVSRSRTDLAERAVMAVAAVDAGSDSCVLIRRVDV